MIRLIVKVCFFKVIMQTIRVGGKTPESHKTKENRKENKIQ